MYLTIFDCIKQNKLDDIRETTDINIINGQNRIGGHIFTPIEYAAYIGNSHALDILYLNGALLTGNTLIWASKGGHIDIVKKIFSFVCQIEKQNDNCFKIACAFAVVNGHIWVVEFLCQNYCFDTEFKKKIISLAELNGYKILKYVTNRA